MEIISVNTCNTGNPAGWWYGDPEHAKKCDYLVEHNNGEFRELYTFETVSARDSEGRFSFIGLRKEGNPIIVDNIKAKFHINNPQKSPQYQQI